MRKTSSLLGVALCFLLAAAVNTRGAGVEEQNLGTLKSITFQKYEKGLEVNLEIEGAYIYQFLELVNPSRLAVDISPINRILAELYYEVNEFGLTGIRTGQYQPYVVRVVFDFAEQIINYRIGKTEKGIRIIFSPEAIEERKEEPVRRIEPRKPEKVRETEFVEEIKKEKFLNTMIGVSLGSYTLSSDRFGEVYGTGGSSIYGFHLSRILFSRQSFHLGLSLEARLFSKTGASTVTLEEAKFTLKPTSLALRGFYETKFIILFVGAGLDSYVYKEESAIHSTSGSVMGNHIQAGAFLRIPQLDSLRLKVFYKTTKVTTTEDEIEVDLGGKEFGVSLSFWFNLF